MKSVFDICYNAETNQCLDIHLPEKEEFPIVLYFHGGGLEAGDKSEEKIFYEYMTSQGIGVVSANYRMYRQFKYPDFLVDAAAATDWVVRNIDSYGKINGIYVGGSSAGGYISQMLCFDEKWLGKYNIKSSDFAGFILDAGQPTCHYNILRERGIDIRRVIIDDSAPLFHIDDKKQLPPMLIIVSDNDMKNRYEQTMLLVSTLKHFGYGEKVELKVMHGTHCAYVNAVDENGDSVFGKLVKDFVCK